MNRSDFLKAVEKQVPLELKGSKPLTVAIDLKIKQDNYYNQDIKEVIENAGRIKINYPDIEQNKLSIIITDQDILTSDYLIEKITPWVQEVRGKIFDSKEAPFDGDLWAGVEWIKKTSEEPLPQNLQKKYAKYYEMIDVLENLKMKGEILGDYTLENKTLEFPGKSGWVENVAVRQQTILYTLYKAVSDMSKATGFKPYSVTAYILSGIKPIIPRASITPLFHWSDIPTGGSIYRKYLNIEINSADLSFAELKEIYDHYRQGLNIKRKKALDPESIKLYNFINDKGGLPEKKGRTAFWRKMQQEWNQIPGNKIFNKWESLYKDYNRTKEKLEIQYSLKGQHQNQKQ